MRSEIEPENFPTYPFFYKAHHNLKQPAPKPNMGGKLRFSLQFILTALGMLFLTNVL